MAPSPLAPNDFTDTAFWVGFGLGAVLEEGVALAAGEDDGRAGRSAAPDPQPVSATSAAAKAAARTNTSGARTAGFAATKALAPRRLV